MKCDKKTMLLYAVTDRAWVGRQSLYEQVECALKGGATCVQVREKKLGDEDFLEEAKQIAALCLTAFMQTTLLFLGLLTFSGNMLLGLGIMLAANEVPRIAQQFGLDSSVRVNMMSVVHATTTAINLTRAVTK